MDGIWRAARAAAEELLAHRNDTVRIVTHIDADALSAAGIAASSLQRVGISFRVTYCKSLDEATLARIRDDPAPLSWFTDLGSAVHDRLGPGLKIITDHHEVPRPEGALAFPHVNPHVHGIEGHDEISGAGCAYLVASALDPRNADLSAVAIVGALGDLQDQRHGRLVGLNRKILADAEAHELVRVERDVRFFGRSSRPLPRFLRYADPSLPSVGDSEDRAIQFLVAQRIPVREGNAWRTWYDLDEPERSRLRRAIEADLTAAGRPLDRLYGEVYSLVRETEPELRDAKEFATLLNSTARYDRPEVGLALAMGVRGGLLVEARALLQGHRRHLGGALQVAARRGFTNLGPIAFFRAGAEIRDTILGIVTGILLGNGSAGRGRVLVGLAENQEGAVKVSARCPDPLVQSGVDLSVSLRNAAESVGGSGGGHAGAAGATIPRGREDEFLRLTAQHVQRQLEASPATKDKTTRL